MGIFYMATPLDFEGKEPEEIVTKCSIDGALGILKACLSSKTVKRVVYTSSSSTVRGTHISKEDEVKDKSSWSYVDSLRTLKTFGWSYVLSTTLTKKAMLEFGEQNGLDVVTLIATFIVGPFICSKLAGSVGTTLYFSLGEKYPHYLQTPMVHVDDVARAHIFLLERPNPKGRYNCSNCLATIEKVTEIVYAKYPEFQTPTIE